MQLKPVPQEVIAESHEEATAILINLMARLTPGEHVARLVVTMEGHKPTTAVLPITVEGNGTADDLIGTEPERLENFAFLLTCGLAQTRCTGVMFVRSPSPNADEHAVVRAWQLFCGVMDECPAAAAAELLGNRLEAETTFVNAFGVHSTDEADEAEADHPHPALTDR